MQRPCGRSTLLWSSEVDGQRLEYSELGSVGQVSCRGGPSTWNRCWYHMGAHGTPKKGGSRASLTLSAQE